MHQRMLFITGFLHSTNEQHDDKERPLPSLLFAVFLPLICPFTAHFANMNEFIP